MRRLRRIDPRIVDWLLAAVLAVSAARRRLATDALVGPAWLTALVAASSGVAAFVRRTRPLTAISVVGARIVILAAWLTPPRRSASLFFGLLLFPYAVGSHVPGRRALVGTRRSCWWRSSPPSRSRRDDQFIRATSSSRPSSACCSGSPAASVRTRTELTAELHEAALRRRTSSARPTPRARSPRSAGGSRARCTTWSRTASRRWSSRPAARAASSRATRRARSRRRR